MASIKPPGDGERRTTFRPPWVKSGPPPLPAPPPAWMGKHNQPANAVNSPGLQEIQTPKLREVKTQKNISDSNDKSKGPQGKPGLSQKQVTIDGEPPKPVARQVEIKVEREDPPRSPKSKPPSREKQQSVASEPIKKQEPVFAKKMPDRPPIPAAAAVPPAPTPTAPPTSGPPPPPPPPPLAPEMCPPPPPPPPSGRPPPGFEKAPLSAEKASKLEALKSRPRRRPDWTDMMKEVESGIKLKHVNCHDRSAPIIPSAKAKGQFVYDSEKTNTNAPHNLLLKEIQSGVQLKKVRTNDRSKPILEGLRKFRRQMTIEEQIQKSASVADVVAVAAEPDELDDIDKVRDDLQSTKQMLALEMRNKEALERENKRLMARLLNMEVELEKEKLARTNLASGAQLSNTRTAEDDKLIQKLKDEAAQSTSVAKEMEEKYHKTAEELDYTRAKLESAWLRNTQLEMELKSKGTGRPVLKAPSNKNLAKSMSSVRKSASTIKAPPPDEGEEEEDEEEEEETETEGDVSDEESDRCVIDKSVSQEERECKLLVNRMSKMKDKVQHTLRERTNLKTNLNKIQKALKEEKKKYRELKKEVDKMANLMKEVDDEEEEEEEEEYEEESESSSEEETEDETSVDSEGDLPEDSPIPSKIENLNRRIKKYDQRLTQAKRQNYFLTANIDRRQDDLNRQKEMSLRLQEDLNEVLADLG